MESGTRLDFAVFQLTPTRTRAVYGLIINANGKTEKIAYGLLNPFLAHLKEAEDQVAKGGYAIILQPNPCGGTSWFTKGTIQRFVHFVNTPEVLERVKSIQSEGLEIEKAIAIQNNEKTVLSTVKNCQKKVKDSWVRSLERTKGNQSLTEVDRQKAVHIYEHEARGSTIPKKNSKVQLLRVLETRRNLLQKEQDMAFARAVAAGFDMDHMGHLISFAKCFGALRFMEACLGFMVLWRLKHEKGQWLDIEAAESVCKRPDFSAMNTPKIMLSDTKLHKEFMEEHTENDGTYGLKSTKKETNTIRAIIGFDKRGDNRPPACQGSCQGQFQQPIMDSKGVSAEVNTLGMGLSSGSQEGPEFQNNGSEDRQQRREAGSYGAKQFDEVVNRNINCITLKTRNSTSAPESETDKEAKDVQVDGLEMRENKSTKSSEIKESYTRFTSTRSSHVKASTAHGKEEDGGNWQAFQNCLLRRKKGLGHSILHKEHPGTVQVCRTYDLTRASTDEFTSQSEFRGSKDAQTDKQLKEIKGGREHRKVTNDDTIISRQNNQADLISSNAVPTSGQRFQYSTSNFYRNSLHSVTDESFIIPIRLSSQDHAELDSKTSDKCDELSSVISKTQDFSTRVRRKLSYAPDELSMIMDGTEIKSIGYDPVMGCEMVVCSGDAVTLQNRKALDAGFKEREKSKVVHKIPEKRKMGLEIKKGEFSKLNPSSQAQACAGKVKSFQEDLLNMKKKREEEEVKRLEAMKTERRKRISARSSSGIVQSTLPSQKRPQTLQTKISPVPYKGSKFSDSEPGKWSPLQMLPIKTASPVPDASQKISKPTRLTNVHVVTTGSNQSGLTLPKLKKENDLTTLEQNSTDAHISRMSGPKLNKKSCISSKKLQSTGSVKTEPKVATDWGLRLSDPKTSNRGHVSSIKLPSTDQVARSKVLDGPDVKKLSTIMRSDRSGIVALPELKTRSLKHPLDMLHNKLPAKELIQTTNGRRPTVKLESKGDKRSIKKALVDINGEDKEVIENTVVLKNGCP